MEDGILKGILTERDIRLHTIPVKGESGPEFLRLEDPVADVMTDAPIVVSPELPLNQLLDLFLEDKVGAVPVVSEERELLGIVSTLDLLVFLRSTEVAI